MLESEKKELEKRLSSGTGTHEEIFEWAKKYQFVEQELDVKTIRWMELGERE